MQDDIEFASFIFTQDINKLRVTFPLYKIMHNLTPAYLTNMFTFSKEVHDRTLRSTADNLLYIPKPNTEHYRNSLAYSGSKIWNSIPNHLRNAVSLQQFRKGYLEWAATQEHSLL